MEPKLPGSGTVAADQTTAAQPPTTNTNAKNQGAGRTTTQDTASLSPPGKQGKNQSNIDESDGR